MLTRVDVQSENPFFLQIRDARPTDSIIVEKIEGLGPPDIDLFLGEYARDGGFYSGRRTPAREVKFTLVYNPNFAAGETVSGLRRMLHKSFLDPQTATDGVLFYLHDDELPDRYIQGFTSKFEDEVFSEETLAMITVMCPNPHILDLGITNQNVGGPTTNFDYAGTADTGFTTVIDVTVNTSTIYLDLSGSRLRLTHAFLAGDTVTVNTLQGSRSITLRRTVGGSTTTVNILYAKVASSTSSWISISGSRTNNSLRVYGATSSNIVADIRSFSYIARYWGV